jgi:arylsulfatase A-like enzyme
MDHNVGRVLDQLERMGARDNTIVVFTGDQGWNAGHHGLWGKGNGTIPFNLYEESIRVPMIWSVPGRVAAGAKSDEMVSHYDFLPTLLDLLDVPLRRDRAMPGQSYRRVLEGRGAPRRDRLYFEYAYVRGQRTSRTKLVMRDGYPGEFYDLQADPGESSNLWDERSGGRQAAERQTEEFFRSIGAPPLHRWRETTTQKMFAYPPPV